MSCSSPEYALLARDAPEYHNRKSPMASLYRKVVTMTDTALPTDQETIWEVVGTHSRTL